MKTTMDRDFVNSATMPSAKARGKKPAQVMRVPDSIGKAVDS